MIVVYVPNVKKSMDFYETVFGWKPIVYDPTGSYGDMFNGEGGVGFVQEDSAEYPITKNNISKQNAFSFVVQANNMENTLKRALANGAKVIKNPHATYYSKQVAVIVDPFGIVITLTGQPQLDYMEKLIKFPGVECVNLHKAAPKNCQINN